VDEWLSVQGSAPRRNHVIEEATAVKPWSFTVILREHSVILELSDMQEIKDIQ